MADDAEPTGPVFGFVAMPDCIYSTITRFQSEINVWMFLLMLSGSDRLRFTKVCLSGHWQCDPLGPPRCSRKSYRSSDV